MTRSAMAIPNELAQKIMDMAAENGFGVCRLDLVELEFVDQSIAKFSYSSTYITSEQMDGSGRVIMTKPNGPD